MEYDASRIAMSLQKVAKWSSFSVEISCTCTVAGLDQLINISRGWTGSKTSLNVKGQDFYTPDHANPHQQIEQRLEQATWWAVDRVLDHVNIQVKCLFRVPNG